MTGAPETTRYVHSIARAGSAKEHIPRGELFTFGVLLPLTILADMLSYWRNSKTFSFAAFRNCMPLHAMEDYKRGQ